jgi:hypothetical protein
MISIVGKHHCWTFPFMLVFQRKLLSPFSRKRKNRQMWRYFVNFRFHDYLPSVHFCFLENHLNFHFTKII